MENWLVQQLRFSAFIQSASHELLVNIWELISTDNPDTDEARPREGFRRLATTADDGSQLELILMPGRIDVIQSLAATAEILPVADLGEAIPKIASFINQISTMLSGLNADVQIQRIALGLILIRPVASREDAYRELQSLLPVTLDPVTSRDFMYQINHPEQFSIGQDSIELHRLSRWSALQRQHFTVQFFAASASTQTGLTSGDNFIRCEVDNSTQADRTEPLPRDSIVLLLNQLVTLANRTSVGERLVA